MILGLDFLRNEDWTYVLIQYHTYLTPFRGSWATNHTSRDDIDVGDGCWWRMSVTYVGDDTCYWPHESFVSQKGQLSLKLQPIFILIRTIAISRVFSSKHNLGVFKCI